LDTTSSEVFFWIKEVLKRREDWISLDAFKLQKEWSRQGKSAPAWFLGSPRAALKLKEKHPRGAELLATTELAEMASRWEVARWRFSRCSKALEHIDFVEFPACGAGLDWLHFLQCYPRFINYCGGGDLNFLATALAQTNLNTIFEQPQTVACYDALSSPFKASKSYVFLDPARRSEGAKLERYSYLPDFEASLKILEKAPLAQIKCAPGETPERLKMSVSRGWTWEWVQRGRDIVECFGTWWGVLHSLSEYSKPWTVTCLDGQGTWLSSYSAEPNTMPFGSSVPLELGQSLILPKAVLLHSELYPAWLQEHGLSESEALGLCVGPCSQISLGEVYTCVALIDNVKSLTKSLNAFSENPFEFRSLVHPVPKDWLSKITPWLAQKGDPQTRKTLLLTRRQGRFILLVLRPYKSMNDVE
jgi:hypothetical protein